MEAFRGSTLEKDKSVKVVRKSSPKIEVVFGHKVILSFPSFQLELEGSLACRQERRSNIERGDRRGSGIVDSLRTGLLYDTLEEQDFPLCFTFEAVDIHVENMEYRKDVFDAYVETRGFLVVSTPCLLAPRGPPCTP